MQSSAQYYRQLEKSDLSAVERLLNTSEYIYQRFTMEELELLLQHHPAVGKFHHTSLLGFLMTQSVNPPCAWIGGFGVSWTESNHYVSILSSLLLSLMPLLDEQRVRYLYYSGNDIERDWLRKTLLRMDFMTYGHLYAYDKYDYSIPSYGNQEIVVRPVRLDGQGKQSDIDALLEIEEECFDPLWRYSATSFYDIARTHPYFVVAESKGRVVGYQFNALEGALGYLIRIAVHPDAMGKGIGVRLMAEAIRYFQRARVSRILLNTQE